jgi:hypothetical protein
MAFDAHSNPRPIDDSDEEQRKSLCVQAPPDDTVTQIDPADTDGPAEEGLEFSGEPPDTAPQIVQPPIASQTQQTLLNFAGPETSASRLFVLPSSSGTHGDRCAVCVYELCPRRFECNGRGRREYCGCNHPPLPKGKKVRISEAQIAKRLAQRNDRDGARGGR